MALQRAEFYLGRVRVATGIQAVENVSLLCPSHHHFRWPAVVLLGQFWALRLGNSSRIIRYSSAAICGECHWGSAGHPPKGNGMLSSHATAALKEWAIVCRALADGRQTLLIRKGGIEEIKPGFQVTHRDFWLFPTYVHQKTTDLLPAIHAEFDEIQAAQPLAGTLQFQLYATVEDVAKVTELERLRALEGYHVLSWDCIASRFNYRRPGVHVMTLRVYRRPDIITLENTPRYDGCVSWVDLDCPLGTEGCIPVLSDAVFGAKLADIRNRLAGAGIVA